MSLPEGPIRKILRQGGVREAGLFGRRQAEQSWFKPDMPLMAFLRAFPKETSLNEVKLYLGDEGWITITFSGSQLYNAIPTLEAIHERYTIERVESFKATPWKQDYDVRDHWPPPIEYNPETEEWKVPVEGGGFRIVK